MALAPDDAPQIIVFPPVVPVATIALAALLQWFYPLDVVGHMPSRPAGLLLGGALLIGGLGLLISGGFALVSAGTNIRPSKPALILVESGAYRWTRNPFYTGGSIAMLGCAFLFGLDWLPLLFLIDLAILHFGIILPEEAYLEQKFGDIYRRYKVKVPRYLGPF